MSLELDFFSWSLKKIQMNWDGSTSNNAKQSSHAQQLYGGCSTHYAESLSHLVNGALKMIIKFLNNGSYEVVFQNSSLKLHPFNLFYFSVIVL